MFLFIPPELVMAFDITDHGILLYWLDELGVGDTTVVSLLLDHPIPEVTARRIAAGDLG